MKKILVTLFFGAFITLSAAECPSTDHHEASLETISIPDQHLTIQGKSIPYEVRAGALTVHGTNENDTASMDYIAYFGAGKDRPIAFCFNGGPGSSSIWLHMGLLGPKVVDLPYPSQQEIHPSYSDNPNSLLAVTDLVFIDPVGTGFSRAAQQAKENSFFGVEEDLFSVADFIRLFLSTFQRWNSPKFLIGESYGTFRAGGLSKLLQEKFLIDVNGIAMISCILDFQARDDEILTSLLDLPTMAVTAQYHHKLQSPLSDLPPPALFDKVGEFAIHEYAPALLLGDALPPADKQKIASQLSTYTSLPAEFIANHNLRISFPLFRSELLGGECVGFYDSRLAAPRLLQDRSSTLDHSFYAISSAFASALESYLTKELKWNPTGNYIFMNRACGAVWDFGKMASQCGERVSVIRDLSDAMLNNRNLSLFVAGGYYDFATPFFAQEYTVNQLLLPESRRKSVTVKGYKGGHMMYLEKPSREALCQDLSTFITHAATAH